MTAFKPGDWVYVATRHGRPDPAEIVHRLSTGFMPGWVVRYLASGQTQWVPDKDINAMTDRQRYAAALRLAADWLDANPGAPVPDTNALLAPVKSPDTVKAIASVLGLNLAADDMTVSASKQFGPILYDAYALAHPVFVPDPGPEPF